jgi:4-hydroxy-tetrahydrodipicolinate reductase
MNIALLGSGKTGSEVANAATLRPNARVTVFNTSYPADLSSLAGHDVVISFLPGDAFLAHIPLLIDSRLPVVCGSTGFTFPGGLDAFSQRIREADLRWIYASNFSLGMHLVRELLPILGLAADLMPDVRYGMRETHHIHKKDAPSGTALSWRSDLGQEVDIASERVGDVVGDHELVLTTGTERITLRHEALNRRIFAEGALQAAEWILNPTIVREPGLHAFHQVIRQTLSTQRHNES